MATQTFQHSNFGDGSVIVEFDINTANWRVSKVRCINNSPYPCVARIYESGSLIYIAEAPAGQTTSWNINGVQLGWDDVDGGIMMGSYVMQAQWPGEV